MLNRKEAKRRLINRYCSAVWELPFGRRPLYPITDFVTDQNVEAVQKLGLYADYSDERRDRALIAAWFRPDTGGPRQ
jgi:hypothetical protein